ncbi:histidine kinase [uncultured Tenacibaculum sp.]|uniref:sensor histidine kinase n=1 Tax=uncultured Tenacibaculum sp. TaxID=174713 RepID=UPI00261C3027|nr:histidine kinase [uncultured Tenacibaculum sp.]
MDKWVKIMSLFWLIITSINCLGQEYQINEILINNSGASKSYEKNLFIDSYGFVWYNTLNGVIREMGNQREFYELNASNGEIIHDFYEIFETKNGMFWVLTEFDTFKINPALGIIQHISPSDKIGKKRNSWFTSIYEDLNKNIWFATSINTFYCLTPNNKTKKYDFNIPFSKQLSIPFFSKIIKVENNEITFLTYNGVYQIALNNNKPLTFLPFPNSYTENIKNSSQKNTIYYLSSPKSSLHLKNYSGKFKIGNKLGSYSYNTKIKAFIFQLPFLNYSIKHLSNNTYKLVATDGEKIYLAIFKISNGVPILKQNSIDTVNISVQKVQFYQDNIIGINGQKIYSFQLYNNSFHRFLNKKGSSVSTRGFVEDANSTIYVASHSGIFKKSIVDSSFTKINFKNTYNNSYLKKNVIYDIEKLKNGNIFLYGFSEDILELDLQNETYTPIKIFNESELKIVPLIIDLLEISPNKLLLATTNGLFYYDLKNKELSFGGNLSPKISLTKEVSYLFLDKENNNLYIGGIQGLYKKDLSNNNITTFLKNDSSRINLSKYVRVITKDVYGNIWAGTRKGLYKISSKLNFKNAVLKNYGLKNNDIIGLIPQGDFLWISTYNGLVQLNISNSHINHYFEKDGIPDNEFNAKSFYKTKNGDLYFGGLNGIVKFNPRDIDFNTTKSSLFCSYIEKYDSKKAKISRKRIGLSIASKKITLSFNHNNLKMGFVLKNSISNAPKDNLFFYRLSYYNSNEWSEMRNTSYLQLKDLPPGNHLLEVLAYDSKGRKSNILKYDISVSQVFYKTKLFYLFIILLFLLSVFFYYSYKKKRIHEKYSIQLQLVKQESKALRAQMNPHFIANALNGIQSVLIFNGIDLARHYLQIFSKLFRTTLDMTNSEWVFLNDEILYLKNYLELEEMRFEKKLNLSFNISPQIDINFHKIPCMLIQPIIENAIIHGLSNKEDNWKLEIDFSIINNFLQVEIIDNGIGRVAAKTTRKNKNRSWSTKILKDRISGYNSIHEKKMLLKIFDLYDGKKALGTKVILYIPIKNNIKGYE